MFELSPYKVGRQNICSFNPPPSLFENGSNKIAIISASYVKLIFSLAVFFSEIQAIRLKDKVAWIYHLKKLYSHMATIFETWVQGKRLRSFLRTLLSLLFVLSNWPFFVYFEIVKMACSLRIEYIFVTMILCDGIFGFALMLYYCLVITLINSLNIETENANIFAFLALLAL